MKRLFLSSSFSDVSSIFQQVVNEELTGKVVTFIPTASILEEVDFYVRSAKDAFERMGLIVDELEISKSSNDEIVNKLEKNDYIYVSGGNTFFLLQELKKSGADKIIMEQIGKGKLFIGESAGSMIVSPDIAYVKDMDNCKEAPDLDSFSALNIIDFYPLPHHMDFPFAEVVEKIISEYRSKLDLRPISNKQAIVINDGEVSIKGE